MMVVGCSGVNRLSAKSLATHRVRSLRRRSCRFRRGGTAHDTPGAYTGHMKPLGLSSLDSPVTYLSYHNRRVEAGLWHAMLNDRPATRSMSTIDVTTPLLHSSVVTLSMQPNDGRWNTTTFAAAAAAAAAVARAAPLLPVT